MLASRDFRLKTTALHWHELGKLELKGLGVETVFQLERKTVSLEPRVEILKSEYDSLKAEKERLEVVQADLLAKNARLADQARVAGASPDPRDVSSEGETQEEDNEHWGSFLRAKEELQKLIRSAGVPSRTYARFLFLAYAKNSGEEYNKFEGRTFDELIEADLVGSEHDSAYYEIDRTHRRNKRAIELILEAEGALRDYLETEEQDPEDLYDWSMKSPEFWRDYVGFDVTKF